MDIRREIIDEATTWLKTPWVHRSHIKGAGVDCAMLIKEVYTKLGLVEEFEVGDYSPDWMLHRSDETFLFWVEKYAHRVEFPLPGDMAIWRHGRTFSHGSIVIDWPRVIHAYRPERGVVISDTSKIARMRSKPVLFYSIIY